MAGPAVRQVVDNSSAFRMTEGVPLIIPEVNPQAIGNIKAGKGGIVANPNCSTIIALMAATPLHRAAGVKRMVVSTYQVQPAQCRLTMKRPAAVYRLLHDSCMPLSCRTAAAAMHTFSEAGSNLPLS